MHERMLKFQFLLLRSKFMCRHFLTIAYLLQSNSTSMTFANRNGLRNACVLVGGCCLLSSLGFIIMDRDHRPQAAGESDPLQVLAAPLSRQGPAAWESAYDANGTPEMTSKHIEINYFQEGLSLLDVFVYNVGLIVVMMLSLWLLLETKILRFEVVLSADQKEEETFSNHENE